MRKSILISVIAVATSLSGYLCFGQKAPIDPIREYLTAADKIRDEEKKSELPLSLAYSLIPKLIDSVRKDYSGREGHWRLNDIFVDLDGDGQGEHLSVFWDDMEYYGFLCALQLRGTEWKIIYSKRLQGWSYRPPSLFVINTPSSHKWVVCEFEETTHSSGIYESRTRVFAIVKGKFVTILDVPKKYCNYCKDLTMKLCPSGDNGISLDIEYTYYESNGISQGREMFSGKASVFFTWNPNKNKFDKSFSSEEKFNARNSKIPVFNRKKRNGRSRFQANMARWASSDEKVTPRAPSPKRKSNPNVESVRPTRHIIRRNAETTKGTAP